MPKNEGCQHLFRCQETRALTLIIAVTINQFINTVMVWNGMVSKAKGLWFKTDVETSSNC